MNGEHTPGFWDLALGYPIMVVVALSLMTMMQILASPRVFRKPWRRVASVILLGFYALAMVKIGEHATSGAWRADAGTFVRFCAQIIPSLITFIATWKLEHSHIDRPIKWGQNGARSA